MNDDPLAGFVPTTPTELALFNEIQRLKRVVWASGHMPPPLSAEPLHMDAFPSLPETLKLHWGARVLGTIGPTGYLQVRVEARCNKEQQFGAQYMVRPEYQNKFIAADHAMHLHQSILRQVTQFLMDAK